MPRSVVLAAIALTFACGARHDAPHVRQLPRPEGSPALRGGGPARSPRNASYKIDAKLDVVHHTITATETLTWTNLGASQVDTLPFHLYLNAFKNESSLLMQTSHGVLRSATATEHWGFLQIDKVTVGGVPSTRLHTTGPGSDETVAELPLERPVAPGASVEVGFTFTAQLPEAFARTGYKGEFNLVAQWFPKIGVRVGPPGTEHWECNPYAATTEFFADFGVYDVSVTVPSTYVVAATGVLANAVESPGGTRTFTYHAEDVHDFAWMADPYMEVLERPAKVADGTIVVRVYHRPEQLHFASRHLEAAVGAVEKFSAWFEPYPWPVLTVIDPPIDAADSAGGIEFPMFVTTAGDTVFARRGLRLPEYVTVHEVGHNWFQGMLASNESEEAWLDEGVNEWADAKVMAELYGARTSGVDWMGWQADISELRMAVDTEPDVLPSPIATAAYAFPDMSAYSQASYVETMKALATLERTVSPAKFAAAMKAYAHQFAFKHPTGRDLFATLEKELGQDLAWFFGPVFQEVGGTNLAIRSAECRASHPARGWIGAGSAKKLLTSTEAPSTGGYVCEVIVQNTGVVHVPVDLDLRFADGVVQREHWDDKGAGNWQKFTVERSSQLVEVILDPDDKIALGSPMTRRYRLAGEGAASMRGASWFAGGVQTLMQLVGP